MKKVMCMHGHTPTASVMTGTRGEESKECQKEDTQALLPPFCLYVNICLYNRVVTETENK